MRRSTPCISSSRNTPTDPGRVAGISHGGSRPRVDWEATNIKATYNVLLTPEADGGYTVFVPDFESATQGASFADALRMARDMISLLGVTLEDMGKEIPLPGSAAFTPGEGDVAARVNVDFAQYRRDNERRD